MVRPASLFIPETQVSHDKMLLLLSRFSRVRLCATNPIDGSPPGCPVPGLLQARTLEWVAICFSNAWNWKWSCSVMSDSSQSHGLQPTRLLHPWDFPGRSTRVGYHCLLWFHGKSWTVFQICFQQVITCIVIYLINAATAKSLQSCPTLWDPIDGSPPGSPVPGILQARTLEWVAISFSNAWKWKVKVKLLSRVPPSATTWTAAFQAPPSMGFSRQEYCNGVPLHKC